MRDILWAEDLLMDDMWGMRPREDSGMTPQSSSWRNWVDDTAIYQDMGAYRRTIFAEHLESSYKDMLRWRGISSKQKNQIRSWTYEWNQVKKIKPWDTIWKSWTTGEFKTIAQDEVA